MAVQELPYGTPGVLGLAPTWPQMAAALPQPQAPEFDWEVRGTQGRAAGLA